MKTAVPKDLCTMNKTRQKAPSAKRCIKTRESKHTRREHQHRQKAPSAKRCIKTTSPLEPISHRFFSVREHRAPKGALRRKANHLSCQSSRCQRAPSAKRCIKTRAAQSGSLCLPVREHRAPKGALRNETHAPSPAACPHRQKAPSTKRCIKTISIVSSVSFSF